ncbi:MAG: multicopper oxidase domain-containing protein [Acetobacteraceae bacterium]|nr:multicopper oxidase domain-containing protein [Acetobacteraceae bacterium]MBV8574925.1 multicopper oxidase domain-containing protein [Acetobacteraceae bacterium]
MAKATVSFFPAALLGITVLALASPNVFAADSRAPPADPCPRPSAGSVVSRPPDLFSRHGELNVAFEYATTLDDAGRTLFCFRTPDGLVSPTLHVKPGDTLNLTLTNKVSAPPAGSPTEPVSDASTRCGDKAMTVTSVNVHYHGTNTSPACHRDEAIHTIINPGQTFQYSLKFPLDQPPGLYWYHPHVHGIAEAAVQGGASGAIIVEGIENVQPLVSGLPERIVIIRDQSVVAEQGGEASAPSWDISLNYVPVPYPDYTPAVIPMNRDGEEFWRVVNASADTIIDLQLQYDGVMQPLSVVGLDGVPTGSQDGTRRGKVVKRTHILIPPAGRAEFIVAAPSAGVRNATLLTLKVDTGPIGDNDPQRPLATIKPTAAATFPAVIMPIPLGVPNPQQFEGLHDAAVTRHRHLYFSEVISDPTNPASPTNFFITVDGAIPALFDPNNPPAITTTQGSVEDWTIENRTAENHEFHMHQIHFELLKRNGVPVPEADQQFLDVVEVPFWSGTGPYPSVKVRMDFRGMDVGDFVYHCHILGHEDNGMMAIIRVLPRS